MTKQSDKEGLAAVGLSRNQKGYEATDAGRTENRIINISRRNFIKTGGVISGALILGFFVPTHEAAVQATTGGGPMTINAFIRIGTDDFVTIIANHSEMGQGVYTSLPMLVAEELEIDLSKVRVEAAPVDPAYNHTEWGMQGTGGSTSVSSEWERLRKIGATAREMLIAAAADLWKVDRATCRAENGAVTDVTGKKASYGQLAERAAKMPVPQQVRLKDPSEFKIIGKPVKRLDTPEKTNGKGIFGIDVEVPGMLVALIARPPVFGGKTKTFNSDKTKAVPGIQAVAEVPSGIAVVAADFWSAKKGRDALEIEWDEGPNAKLSTDTMFEQYSNLAKKPGAVARKDGDAPEALLKATKQIRAEYKVPYLAHATMEPLNCVVDLRPDKCEIWTGTQMQTVDRNKPRASRA